MNIRILSGMRSEIIKTSGLPRQFYSKLIYNLFYGHCKKKYVKNIKMNIC